jgi:hypothetical protein
MRLSAAPAPGPRPARTRASARRFRRIAGPARRTLARFSVLIRASSGFSAPVSAQAAGQSNSKEAGDKQLTCQRFRYGGCGELPPNFATRRVTRVQICLTIASECLGYTESSRDHAHGFFFTGPLLFSQGGPRSAGDRLSAVSSPIAYWYRDSVAFFQPRTFSCCDLVPGQVGMWQPPIHSPGERLVVLDRLGQLQHLQIVPEPDDRAERRERPTNWPGMLATAGLSVNDLQSTRPLHIPPVFADERAAWQRTVQTGRTVQLPVEAAALGGRVVFFERGEGFASGLTSERPQSPPAQSAGDVINAILIVLVTTLGVAFAFRNVRRRRSDRRGALRLLAAGYLIDILTWVLLADHVPEPNYELRLVEMASSWASLRAAVLWVAYVAIEPYVRRRWPHGMVSWNRLLAGRFTDPKLVS